MQTELIKITACLVLVAALGSCSGGGPEDTAETAGDQSLAEHLKVNWGIAVDGFSVDAFIVDDDGTQVLFDDGVITVDGLGSQEVSTQTVIDPAASGGQVTFFVANADLSEERYFLFDQVDHLDLVVEIRDLGTAFVAKPVFYFSQFIFNDLEAQAFVGEYLFQVFDQFHDLGVFLADLFDLHACKALQAQFQHGLGLYFTHTELGHQSFLGNGRGG